MERSLFMARGVGGGLAKSIAEKKSAPFPREYTAKKLAPSHDTVGKIPPPPLLFKKKMFFYVYVKIHVMSLLWKKSSQK